MWESSSNRTRIFSVRNPVPPLPAASCSLRLRSRMDKYINIYLSAELLRRGVRMDGWVDGWRWERGGRRGSNWVELKHRASTYKRYLGRHSNKQKSDCLFFHFYFHCYFHVHVHLHLHLHVRSISLFLSLTIQKSTPQNSPSISSPLNFLLNRS